VGGWVVNADSKDRFGLGFSVVEEYIDTSHAHSLTYQLSFF